MDERFDKILSRMEVGDCLEIGAGFRTTYNKIQRSKERLQLSSKFTVRKWGPYFTRVWRIE